MISRSAYVDFDMMISGKNDLSRYIFISSAGYQRCITKDISIMSMPRVREDYQIIYIVSGCGYFMRDGKRITVKSGSLVLYRPGEYQAYGYYHGDKTEVYWAHFGGFGMEQILSELGFDGKFSVHIGIHGDCKDAFRHLMATLEVKHKNYIHMARAQLYTLLTTAASYMERACGSTNPVERAVREMERDLASQKPLRYYADLCGFSPGWFLHVFKEHTGLTPLSYIQGLRTAKSKELLSTTELSVGEISEHVGYINPLYFSRVFKAQTGVCPTEYRKNNRL